MILCSSRSAKSVAWSRLNVIGVSAVFLARLGRGLDQRREFHSVTNTRWPLAISHSQQRELRRLARPVDAFDDEQTSGVGVRRGERVEHA